MKSNVLYSAAFLVTLSSSCAISQVFKYDEIGRVSKVTFGSISSEYTYDPAGNISTIQVSNVVVLTSRNLSSMPSMQGLMEFEINRAMVSGTVQEFSISEMPPGIELINPSSLSPDGSPLITISSEPGSTTTRIKLQFKSSVSPPPEFTPVLFVVSSSVPVPANPDLSISGLRRMEDGKVRVDFTCVPKKRYVVQSSADLNTWTNVSQAMEATGPTLVWQGKTEGTGTGASKNAFYRVIQVQ